MKLIKIPGAQHPGSPKIKREGYSSLLPMEAHKPDFTIKPASTRKGKSEGMIMEEHIASPLLIPEEAACGHASKIQQDAAQPASRTRELNVDFRKVFTNIFLIPFLRGCKARMLPLYLFFIHSFASVCLSCRMII